MSADYDLAIRRAGSPPEESGARSREDITAAVESVRVSITNSMRKGDGQLMSADTGLCGSQLSRQMAGPPTGDHLKLSILLAAINRDLRRGEAHRIEAWKQLIFGGVTEMHEEEVAVVRFTKDGRQFQLLGDRIVTRRR